MLQQWFDNFRELATLHAQLDATFWAKVASIAAIVSIVVSAAALVGLFMSLKQTSESLLENRRTGALERRPWVTIREIKIGRSALNFADGEGKIATEIMVTLENTGLSPALDANLEVTFSTDLAGSDRSMEALEFAFPDGSAIYPPNSIASEQRVAVISVTKATGNQPLFVEVSCRYKGAETEVRHSTVALAAVQHALTGHTFEVGHLPTYYDRMQLEPLIHIHMT